MISGSPNFYDLDQLSSIRAISNNSGAIQSTYNYDSWGRVTSAPGSGIVSDFGYAGYYIHKPSGLNLTRRREYQPWTGTFISRDPVAERGAATLYEYALNDPIDFLDPSGLAPRAGLNQPYQYYKEHSGEIEADCKTVGPVIGGIGFVDGIQAEQEAKAWPGGTNGPQDAIRHCILSCLMASHMSDANAKKMGDCHEEYGPDAGSENSEMDKNNNASGRKVAHCPGSCKDKCAELYDNGTLVGRGGVSVVGLYGPGY